MTWRPAATPPTRPNHRGGVGAIQSAPAPRAEAALKKEIANELPKGAEAAFQKWSAQHPGEDWRTPENRKAILEMHRGGLQQAARSPEPVQPMKSDNKKS